MRHPLPLYPLLIGVFLILSLYAVNRYWVTADVLVVPMLMVIAFVIASWCAGVWVLKDRQAAALLVAFSLLMFFSYGYVRDSATTLMGGVYGIARHRYLYPLWLGAFGVGVIWIVRRRRNYDHVTSFFTLVSLVLVCLPVLVMVQAALIHPRASNRDIGASVNKATGDHARQFPDIYYIILDGYSRADTLRSLYRYDNEDFLRFLRKRGFFIAGESTSNYATTPLSLASSLNMTYLTDVTVDAERSGKGFAFLNSLIRKNAVVNFLKSYGYTIVQFRSGWEPTDRGLSLVDKKISCGGLSGFNEALIRTTMLRPFRRMLDQEHRNRIRCIFAGLPDSDHQTKGPRFIFAHLLVPHPPFIFRHDGQPRDVQGDVELGEALDWTDRSGYIEQLQFVNAQVEQVIDRILSARADHPPVIVLQGDHGSASTGEWEHPSPQMLKERMRIFNAYLLPVDHRAKLSPSVTPVNTFRIIFHNYFDAGYELLPDENYFSNYDKPYALTKVTSQVR